MISDYLDEVCTTLYGHTNWGYGDGDANKTVVIFTKNLWMKRRIMMTKRNTWAWIYGDECDFLWEHFGMEVRNSDDRMKIKFVEFEEGEEEGDDDE